MLAPGTANLLGRLEGICPSLLAHYDGLAHQPDTALARALYSYRVTGGLVQGTSKQSPELRIVRNAALAECCSSITGLCNNQTVAAAQTMPCGLNKAGSEIKESATCKPQERDFAQQQTYDVCTHHKPSGCQPGINSLFAQLQAHPSPILDKEAPVQLSTGSAQLL